MYGVSTAFPCLLCKVARSSLFCYRVNRLKTIFSKNVACLWVKRRIDSILMAILNILRRDARDREVGRLFYIFNIQTSLLPASFNNFSSFVV